MNTAFRFSVYWLIAVCAAIVATPLRAHDLAGLARLEVATTGIETHGRQVTLLIGMSQPVPYRIFHLAEPNRLVMEFNDLDWTGFEPDALEASPHIAVVRAGPVRPGWSRILMEVDDFLALASADMKIEGDGRSVLVSRLMMVSKDEFLARAGAPEDLLDRHMPQIGLEKLVRRKPGEPLVVALDPGHGGIDPGAVVGEVEEADLMLAFAVELKELLQRTGQMDVKLTRSSDVFVSLEQRIALAHRSGAHVFLSLHADALAGGTASGVTLYTLTEEASDIAAQKLAERHDRQDILSGVDLTRHDDEVAEVLIDLARTETNHRATALAEALIGALGENVELYKKPLQSAGFSVLKSPDLPSVLIELGFLSSARDKEKLLDKAWRERAARAIRDGLILWMSRDAAEAEFLRK